MSGTNGRPPSTPPWMDDELAEIDASRLRRRRVVVERPRPGIISVDGADYVDFASNDYLGLAGDRRLVLAAARAAEAGVGAGASPLITGYHLGHERLEQAIAAFEGTEAALFFASGFAANLSLIPAFCGRNDLICADRRNHASLIDGCRLSGATVRRYDTPGLEGLERALGDSARFRRRLVVTDSVFSMDGDIAPLEGICELAERHDALVYLDEAHGTGVLGHTGRGAAQALGVEDRIALRMGTLSKAAGVSGAFAAVSSRCRDWLLHRARGYVYSTSPALPVVGAAAEALRLIAAEPQRKQRVAAAAQQLRERLADAGLATGRSVTPIVPVLLGEPEEALGWSARLREAGMWVGAIRPPTVPVGTARLRISVSAAHEPSHLAQLAGALATLAESSHPVRRERPDR